MSINTVYAAAAAAAAGTNANGTIATVTKEKVEAANYVWDALWKPDETHIKLNILDAVRFTSSGVAGWLFTSNDGLVKSKSKSKWNAESIVDRCASLDTTAISQLAPLLAHWTNDYKIWHQATIDSISNFCNSPDDSITIVSFAHLQQPSSKQHQFIEQCYVNLNALKLPSVTTSLLCGSAAKGIVAIESTNVSAIPSQKLQCMSKTTNEISKLHMYDVAKSIEVKNRTKVTKLVAVSIIENTTLEDGTGSIKLWLHHVKEVVYTSTMNSESNSSNGNGNRTTPRQCSETMSRADKKSVTYSQISNSMSSFQRLSKCNGDFCTYNPAEEEYNIQSEVSNDFSGNLLDESKKARIRFRQATGKDVSHITGKPKLVVAQEEEPIGNDSAHVYVKSRDDHKDSQMDIGGDGAFVGMKKSQAHYVPYKSISLSRQDMSDLEHQGEMHYSKCYIPWSELLYQWWWRAGRAVAQNKGSVPVPESSGHRINVAILSNASILTEPIATSSATNNSTNLSKHKDNYTSNDNKDDFSHIKSYVKGSDVPPLGLMSKSVHAKSAAMGVDNSIGIAEKDGKEHRVNALGQLSWYYSDAKVCENCYQVYRDIDRRRRHKQMSLMKSQKRILEHEDVERGKVIEKKMFEQRKHLSRLTKVSRRIAVSNDDIGNSSHSNNSNSSSNIIPRSSLPPMPWKLRDPENREQYLNTSTSAFVRNLPLKVEHYQQIANQERYLADRDLQRRKVLGGMLDEDNIVLDTASNVSAGKGIDEDPKHLWDVATGKYNNNSYDYNASKKKKKSLRMPKKIVSAKDFDSTHLLHPWQRDMQQLKSDVDNYGYDAVLHKIKSSATTKANRQHLKRTNSLPPLEQRQQQQQQQQQYNNENSFNNLVGGGSQITLDSAFDERSYGFVGLASRRNNDYSNDSSVEIKQERSHSNDGKKTFTISIQKDNHSNKSDDKNSVATNKLRDMLRDRIVSFDDHTTIRNSAHAVNSTAVSNTSKSNYNSSQSHIPISGNGNRAVSNSSYDNDDDDGEDDDDDDDTEIGWSPFIVPAL